MDGQKKKIFFRHKKVMAGVFLDHTRHVVGPMDRRTKSRSIKYIPGMKPACKCVRLETIFYDASGNEWDGDELEAFYRPGWTWKRVAKPDDRSFDHQDQCPLQRYIPPFPELMQPRLKHEGNGTHKGAFAFTLTKSPKDSVTVGEMIAAVKKLMTQQSCRVKKYAWYLEYKGTDDAGLPNHPHIHGMYETETGGRIEAKHFKRAWPLWDEKVRLGQGFRGGFHAPVKDETQYSEYIKKDGGIGESSPCHIL